MSVSGEERRHKAKRAKRANGQTSGYRVNKFRVGKGESERRQRNTILTWRIYLVMGYEIMHIRRVHFSQAPCKEMMAMGRPRS